jgi:hypothetical protein
MKLLDVLLGRQPSRQFFSIPIGDGELSQLSRTVGDSCLGGEYDRWAGPWAPEISIGGSRECGRPLGQGGGIVGCAKRQPDLRE